MGIRGTQRKCLKIDSTQSQGLFEGYGGKEWYEMAKRLCDNFEVRVKEGYCVTLITPIVRFKKKCSDCELGIGLKGGL